MAAVASMGAVALIAAVEGLRGDIDMANVRSSPEWKFATQLIIDSMMLRATSFTPSLSADIIEIVAIG